MHTLLIMMLIGAVFSALLIAHSTLLTSKDQSRKPSQKNYIAPTSTPAESYRGLPIRLRIPAINIDAGIEYLGLTSSGDMKAPASPTTVGWYKYGAIPGEVGSAVIAGHVVGSKGQPAIFANIHKLQKGDKLLIVDSKDQTATFVIQKILTYKEQEQHAEVFNSGPGTHLNIITCAGEWDSRQHHYLERLVVFADKITTV